MDISVPCLDEDKLYFVFVCFLTCVLFHQPCHVRLFILTRNLRLKKVKVMKTLTLQVVSVFRNLRQSRRKLVKYSIQEQLTLLTSFFPCYVDQENLEAEMKKLGRIQKKVKNIQQQQRKEERASKKSKTILICIIRSMT